MQAKCEIMAKQLRDLAEKYELLVKTARASRYYCDIYPIRARIKRDGLNLRKDLVQLEKEIYG